MVYEGQNYKMIQKKYPLKNQKKINFFIKCKLIIFRLIQNNKSIQVSYQKNKFYKLIHFKLIGKKIERILPKTTKIAPFKLNISKNLLKQKLLLYMNSTMKKI